MPLTADQQVYRAPYFAAKNFSLWRGVKRSRYWGLASQVIDKGASLRDLPDDELRRLGNDYHQQALNGDSLDRLLVPAFALAREVARRTLGLEPYPVQVLAGIAMHRGHVVEMATGEGKTLAAALPSYLNALSDRGVHVVTVNDYLARRDATQIGQIHHFLGMTVGLVTNNMSVEQRLLAYRASITYATNKEIGFDFLRDQLRGQSEQWFEFGKGIEQLRVQKVQRPDFHYAIVDEVDSILIDEARTPLIIANAPLADPEVADEFQTACQIVPQLAESVDFTYERKERRLEWLRSGEQRITHLLGGRRSLSGHRIDWHEACLRALKAHVLYHRDVEYVVEDDEIVIVDENTGRKMPGRQWEDGIHQAVAAKEKLPIKAPNETLARTTYQVYFNRYQKLAGMTGTADTEAIEFAEVFGLGTLPIPTNRLCVRQVHPDRVYASESAKWTGVIEEIEKSLQAGRAVLVGTRSIEKSELLSDLLRKAGIEHVVLNARHEAREAAIVAQAGAPGRVTVATNMAGRGTDIQLHPDVRNAGGLHVVGTERHESRRIDNQLIGRCARQGDPGSARFFVSVEDPLIRRFRPVTSARLTKRFAGRTEPIDSRWIRGFFRRVQRGIERYHRSIRYQLIKYDRERSKFNRQLGTE